MSELLTHLEEQSEFHSPLEDHAEGLQDQLVLNPELPRTSGEGREQHIVLPPEAYAVYEHALHQPDIHHHLQEVKKKDPATYDHMIGVANKTLTLAWLNRHEENLSAEDLFIITKAALVHDVGKLDLEPIPYSDDDPTPVLPQNSTKRFSRQEKVERMNPHVMKGINRLTHADHPVLDPRVLAIALGHHQRQENPTMLQEDADEAVRDLGVTNREDKRKVDLAQVMLEVSDKFDAQVEGRSYKDPYDRAKIESDFLDELARRGVGLKFARQLMAIHYPDRYRV